MYPDDTRATEPPPIETWIELEEREARRNKRVRALALGLGVALLLALAALVASLIALNRDVEAAATAPPAAGSVGPDALADEAVTADKLAAGAVGTDALADEAVTAAKLAPGAIGTVERAREAGRAEDADALGGIAAPLYLSGIEVVQATSSSDTQPIKGPVVARCPSGTGVVSGGAALDGVSSGVAIVRSSPEGSDAWAAKAEAFTDQGGPWRLVVTAICGSGG